MTALEERRTRNQHLRTLPAWKDGALDALLGRSDSARFQYRGLDRAAYMRGRVESHWLFRIVCSRDGLHEIPAGEDSCPTCGAAVRLEEQ